MTEPTFAFRSQKTRIKQYILVLRILDDHLRWVRTNMYQGAFVDYFKRNSQLWPIPAPLKGETHATPRQD